MGKDNQTVAKKKFRFRLTKGWIMLISIVALIGIAYGTVAIINSSNQNPATKVLERYLSAAKNSNIERMVSTYYKKGTAEYDELVSAFKKGKDQYSDFIDEYNQAKERAESKNASDADRENFEQIEAEYEAYNIASMKLDPKGEDLRDFGLWLESEQIFAKTVNGFDYFFEIEEEYFIQVNVISRLKATVRYEESFGIPAKLSYYARVNELPEKYNISFKKVDGNWTFSSLFRLLGNEAEQQTWFAPFDEKGVELKYITLEDLTSSGSQYILDIPALEQKYENKISSIGNSSLQDVKENVTSVVLSENVTNLAKYAFKSCTKIESVKYVSGEVTKDSPLTIGEGVFYECKALKSFILPDINKTVPSFVFYDCKALTSTYFNPDVTSIGYYAFTNTSITNVNIGSSIKAIGEAAFSGCSSLRSFNEGNVLPDSISRLGINVFKGCTRLTNCILPQNLQELSSGMFDGCTSITSVTLPKTLRYIGNNVFRKTAIREIAFPDDSEESDGILEIGNGAFEETRITSIDWGKNPVIKSIGATAFKGCTELFQVVLPKTIYAVGAEAFVGCTKLRSVMVNMPYTANVNETAFKLKNAEIIAKFYVPFKEGMVYDAKAGKEVKGDINLRDFNRVWSSMSLSIYSQNIITREVLADGTEGEAVFAIEKKQVTDIAGNTTTETELVQYFGNSESILLDTSITRIQSGAFAYATNLKTIENFDELSLNYIGSNVFTNSGIQFERFGRSRTGYLNYLGNWLIDGSEFSEATIDLISTELTSTSSPQLVRTVGIAASAFYETSGSKVRANTIRINKELKYICDNAFSSLITISNVEFENNSTLSNIGVKAFYGCETLDSIDLPASVKIIEDSAFGACSLLRFVEINTQDQLYIGNDVFASPFGILKVYIDQFNENDFYSTGKWSAYSAYTLDSDIISGDFATNGDKLIQYLGKTRNAVITIPENLTKIELGAFAYSRIGGVIFNPNVTTIEEYAFNGCVNLKTIVFQADEEGNDSLKLISNYAFLDCPEFVDGGTMTFMATNPQPDFVLEKEAFDGGTNGRIIVDERENYEENRYWLENSEKIAAKDDPRIIIEYILPEGSERFANDTTPKRGVSNVSSNKPGEELIITAIPDTASGFVFAGWFEDAEGTIPLGGDSETLTVIFEGKNTTTTYYAKFERVEMFFTLKDLADVADVSFSTGVIYTGNKVLLTKGTIITLTAKEGSSFAGWQINGSTQLDNRTEITIVIGEDFDGADLDIEAISR